MVFQIQRCDLLEIGDHDAEDSTRFENAIAVFQQSVAISRIEMFQDVRMIDGVVLLIFERYPFSNVVLLD